MPGTNLSVVEKVQPLPFATLTVQHPHKVGSSNTMDVTHSQSGRPNGLDIIQFVTLNFDMLHTVDSFNRWPVNRAYVTLPPPRSRKRSASDSVSSAGSSPFIGTSSRKASLSERPTTRSAGRRLGTQDVCLAPCAVTPQLNIFKAGTLSRGNRDSVAPVAKRRRVYESRSDDDYESDEVSLRWYFFN